MEPQRLSIAVDDVRERVRFRIAAGREGQSEVVWSDQGDELLIDLDALRCNCKAGWLLCELSLEAAGSGRQRLHCIYFLGREDAADGVRSAATIRPADPAGEGIADRWGRALLRVVWDGVLDVIEGTVSHVAREAEGGVELLGFGCSDKRVHIDLIGGR